MSDREQPIASSIDDELSALREALEQNAPDAAGFARVRASVKVLCTRARRDGIAPEFLLVRLKETLDRVRGFDRRGDDMGARDEARGRIVSYAIDAYYSTSDGPR